MYRCLNTLSTGVSDMVEIIEDVNLDELYQGSAYTITGAGGELKEWFDGYQDILNEKQIGNISKWYVFSGKDLNRKYNLTGDNRYQSNITFIAFPLTGLDIGKLAMLKLQMGDRWFDDIVDNDLSREEEN